jgi:hypothetical protein
VFAGSTPVPRITLLVFVNSFLVDFSLILDCICLPDEVNLLREMEAEKELEGKPEEEKIRMLLVCRDDAVPVYVIGQGKTVRKRGERRSPLLQCFASSIGAKGDCSWLICHGLPYFMQSPRKRNRYKH